MGVEGWSCVLPFSTGTPVRKLRTDCVPVWFRARPFPSTLPKEIPPPSALSGFLTALFLTALVKGYGKLYIFVAFINLFPFQQYTVKPVVRLFLHSSVTVVLPAASWSFSMLNNHSLQDLHIEQIDTRSFLWFQGLFGCSLWKFSGEFWKSRAEGVQSQRAEDRPGLPASLTQPKPTSNYHLQLLYTHTGICKLVKTPA